jgi:hypothetical protein
MTIATDQEIRRAVDAWARARGWWNAHNGADLLLTGPWSVQWQDGVLLFHALAKPSTPRHIIDEWRVSPHAALVWALLVESGSRVGRCSACDGTGHGFDTRSWQQGDERVGMRVECNLSWSGAVPSDSGRVLTGLRGVIESEPHHAIYDVRLDGESKPVLVRSYNLYPLERSADVPCPDCEGTGKQEAARLVLDAQPRPCPRCRGTSGYHTPHGDGWQACWRCAGGTLADKGDPASIEALHVLADRLQRDGDPLGTHLAHLLAGSLDGTGEAVERAEAATERHRQASGYVETVVEGGTDDAVAEAIMAHFNRPARPADEVEPGEYSVTVDGLPTITVDAGAGSTSTSIASALAAEWNASPQHNRVSTFRVDGDSLVMETADSQAQVWVSTSSPANAEPRRRRTGRRARPRSIGSKAARRRF